MNLAGTPKVKNKIENKAVGLLAFKMENTPGVNFLSPQADRCNTGIKCPILLFQQLAERKEHSHKQK
jgi:hypothetical protein